MQHVWVKTRFKIGVITFENQSGVPERLRRTSSSTSVSSELCIDFFLFATGSRSPAACDVCVELTSSSLAVDVQGEAALERLASLLPFPEEVTTSLDKLSILRLSVSYLRAKNFFSDEKSPKTEAGLGLRDTNSHVFHDKGTTYLSTAVFDLQALNGFVLVITASGTIFYSSHTIQDYLGFHQTDVMHQSVYELVHTEDQQELRKNLHWALNPPNPDSSSSLVTYSPEHLPPENSSFLERSFMCRFRCLLDNSSGFLALNIQGRLKFLHGQNQRQENGGKAPPQLALFAIATPLQPPSILEIRTKNMIFRTKHKLDFTPLACDAKGKIVLGYTEAELRVRGSGYQFIHAADMLYCAENHVRMMKTGESGLTVFRLLTKENRWKWVQANARLVYKNGKPDYIIATQRPLLDEEGGEHLRKRSMHLPFTYATGEALLYQSNHPIAGFRDAAHEKNGSKSKKNRTDRLVRDGLDPGSLLGALMSQDESVYVCQPAVEPKVSFHSGFFGEQVELSDSQSSGLRGSWDRPANGAMGVVDVDDGGCSNGELFGALEGLGLSAEDLELLLLDERMIRVEMDPERVPTLDDLLTNDEILSYIYDSIEGKTNSTELGGPALPGPGSGPGSGRGSGPSSGPGSGPSSSVTLPDSSHSSSAPVQMQFPPGKPPVAEPAPIVQLSQQMQQHLNMRSGKAAHTWSQQSDHLAMVNGDLLEQDEPGPDRRWTAQDILTTAGIQLGHFTPQQTVFGNKTLEMDGELHPQHQHFLQQQSQLSQQQCIPKPKAANLNGLCSVSNADLQPESAQWQDFGFSDRLGGGLDSSQKPLATPSLESCMDYSLPGIDNGDFTIGGGSGLFGRSSQQQQQLGVETTVTSFQGLNHKQQQDQIPVPLAQVISSLSQCPPPNTSLDQILGVGKPCRPMDHYGMVTSDLPHNPTRSKVRPPRLRQLQEGAATYTASFYSEDTTFSAVCVSVYTTTVLRAAEHTHISEIIKSSMREAK
uniref:Aryl hydrocarbon receptor-like n=1 Tax=Salarias fasciatus TaxID=181472 RepID=A0A672IR03_SALFA